jgi:hypothetical protein
MIIYLDRVISLSHTGKGGRVESIIDNGTSTDSYQNFVFVNEGWGEVRIWVLNTGDNPIKFKIFKSPNRKHWWEDLSEKELAAGAGVEVIVDGMAYRYQFSYKSSNSGEHSDGIYVDVTFRLSDN